MIAIVDESLNLMGEVARQPRAARTLLGQLVEAIEDQEERFFDR